MPQSSRLVADIPINLASGTQTVNTLLDPLDLSMAKVLEVILSLTSIQTVAGTTLDVKLQMATYYDSAGNTVWDTRGRFSLVPGTTPATATLPYQEGLNISQDVDLTTAERTYRPTGSNGGTELAAGTVRDGNFEMFLRGRARGTGRQERTSGARIQIVETDAAASGAFVGNVQVFAHLWDW